MAHGQISGLRVITTHSPSNNTPVKLESSSSRPSSSHTVASSNARTESPAQFQPLRRSSSSFAPGPVLPSPQIHKRLSTSSLKGPQSPSSPRFPTSRRSSSNLPARPASQISFHGAASSEADVPKPRTAASVGADYFAKELALHDRTHQDSETIVIIHEACYGHRFSRPRTSKAALSTIVERPERITAAVLGLSTAYVRLGSRHAGGLAPPAPGDDLTRKSPFAIRRSSRSVGLLSTPVVSVHGREWMNELQAMCLAAGARLALDGKELLRPVGSEQFHEGDLYLCAESLEALQGAVGGVCDAVDAVFSESLTKRAFVAVRPPGHHCSADFPSGFCWLNNVHVGIQHAAQTHGLTHAVILDFDLHHGDGSQEITWDINERNQAMPKNTAHSKKAAIGYYSLHDINSYPCESGDKEKVQNASLCIDNAHGQSIWNVHLEPWSSEADFARLYETKYSVIFDKARSFLQKQTARINAAPKGGKPRAAVFISAGFDASQWEGAGMQRHAVNVPTSFYERFTRDAVKLAQDASTAAEGRCISVLEGGYSNRALTSGVLSHVSGLCQPAAGPILNGGSREMELADIPNDMSGGSEHVQPCDSKWWNSEALHALETYEATEVALPKKVRTSGFIPTFASPTESFSNKVVDQEKFYRSMSGTMRPLPEFIDTTIPEVDWIAASHALCKVLLAASRTKKQRQSMGRQLRDRKAKTSVDGSSGPFEEENGSRPSTSRRKTLDAPGAHTASPAPTKARATTSRRSSASPLPAVPSIPAAFASSSPSTPAQGAAGRRTRKSPNKAAATSNAPLQSPDPVAVNGSVTSNSKDSSTASFETAPSTTSDMDSLTSAVKRITLKQEAERAAKRKAPRKAAAVDPVKLKAAEARPAPSQPAPSSQQPLFHSTGVANSLPARSVAAAAAAAAPPPSTSPMPTPIAAAIVQDASKLHSELAQQLPQPDPAPVAPPQQQPQPKQHSASIAALLNPSPSLTPQRPVQGTVPDSAARQLHAEEALAMRQPQQYQQYQSQQPQQGYRSPPIFSATGTIPFASAPAGGVGNGVSRSMLGGAESPFAESGGEEGGNQ
ncbi:Arginase/deacetylase [Myriangium duriaei CBS 260.36]|uniref:Arginase/deacetylase n=1 Tax=Myriangium duriaei CBS 260.36 TaxID=1168546 RepID=A0A9P4J6N1_9PEZI|nr:Arginase/deacetylase [Myriangium duriaei CBS 260.36]